jgi:hypothetical protein
MDDDAVDVGNGVGVRHPIEHGRETRKLVSSAMD